MLNSIYVGMSGLSAYSRGLQQVSNNVTNLNSSGFKSSTVSFTDLVSYGGRGGLSQSSGGSDRGNGVANAETRIDFRQGELRQTQRDLDLAVNGNGFMMLMRGSEVFYTRTGSFEVDAKGHLVLAGTDYRLATLDAGGTPVTVSIDPSRTSAPEQTKVVTFAENLSATSPATGVGVGEIKVFAPGGGQHVWQAKFVRAEAPGEWTLTVTDEKSRAIGTATVKFNAGGTIDLATAKPVFTDAENGLSVTFDLSQGVTSFSTGALSTLRAASVDGHGSGAISTLGVNNKGRLEIGYTNGEKLDLGAVALADFRDPQSLEQRGGGLFVQPDSSSERRLTTSEDGRAGRVESRRLEASNVDLASQFGDLILIQRGFQASSQIISVSNDMLQQLFGIRGQG
jgi:flagellar hook protein FlgE